MTSHEIVTLFWVAANLATGVAYFMIPVEIWRWSRHVSFTGLIAVSWLFIGFIAFCGAHHFVMPFTAHRHHVEAWVLATDVPMAAASLLSHWVIVMNRQRIIAALRWSQRNT